MNLIKLFDRDEVSNKQLLITTGTVFCVGQVTNHTPLRTPVQWIFVFLLFVWLMRFMISDTGKKVSDALLFAAFMQNFRK